MIVGFVPNPSNGRIAFDVMTLSMDCRHIEQVRTPDLDPTLGSTGLNRGIRDAIESHCRKAWKVPWDSRDTVLIVAGVSTL